MKLVKLLALLGGSLTACSALLELDPQPALALVFDQGLGELGVDGALDAGLAADGFEVPYWSSDGAADGAPDWAPPVVDASPDGDLGLGPDASPVPGSPTIFRLVPFGLVFEAELVGVPLAVAGVSDCPPGAFVLGIEAALGPAGAIRGLRSLCAEVLFDPTRGAFSWGEVGVGEWRGAAADESVLLACPEGAVGAGMAGSAELVLDQLALRCGTLAATRILGDAWLVRVEGRDSTDSLGPGGRAADDELVLADCSGRALMVGVSVATVVDPVTRRDVVTAAGGRCDGFELQPLSPEDG